MMVTISVFMTQKIHSLEQNITQLIIYLKQGNRIESGDTTDGKINMMDRKMG